MNDLVLEQIRSLAGTLAALNGRVRQAVAGEVGRAVAEAVGEVLVAALGGPRPAAAEWARPAEYDPYATYRPGQSGPYAWDADRPGWDAEPATRQAVGSAGAAHPPAPAPPDAPAALALAVAAGRWWLARRGSPWGAAGVGLAVAGTLLAGGPAARTALGILWAAHRLMAATAALGDGAKALDRV